MARASPYRFRSAIAASSTSSAPPFFEPDAVIQLTPQMRVLIAVDPLDFRKGLNGLQGVCRQRLSENPLSGTIFAFRNRAGTAVRLLVFDGTGSWLLHNRFSQGKLCWWPADAEAPAHPLAAQELAVILYAGDPSRASFSPDWRKLA
jgi:transposase